MNNNDRRSSTLLGNKALDIQNEINFEDLNQEDRFYLI